MKIIGFSFIKNAILYDYPIVEAISSILPICSKVVVAVGKSEDRTSDLIKKIDPSKIEIIETVWDENLRAKGAVLAIETNKALKSIKDDYDWAFYIQGDEVLHECYFKTVLTALKQWKEDPKVDGLLFKYRHFYASFDYVGNSYDWYRREIRLIKNKRNIYSYGDAQGFRKNANEKLNVKLIDAYIYHYGWVKTVAAMRTKLKHFHRYWHDDTWLKSKQQEIETFDFKNIRSLQKFEGTHPQVMQERIKAKNWSFDYDLTFNRYTFKDRFRSFCDKYFNYVPWEYRNYKLLRD